MKRRLAYSLCLLALALCWGALPALAGTLPISGTFGGNSTLTPTSTPGVYIQNFTGDGDDATFGSFTPSSMSTIDFSNPPNIVITDATFLETFGDANGTLFGTNSGNGSGTNTGPGTATFTVNLLITGGTGYFVGETGNMTIMGTITLTSPTTASISNGSYTGSLTPSPEPSAAILMGTALMATVLGAVWRRSS